MAETLTDDQGIGPKTPVPGEASPEEEQSHEAVVFLGIFVVLGALLVGFLIVYFLRHFRVTWFPEAWVFATVGLLFGTLVRMDEILGLGLGDLTEMGQTLNESFASIFFIVLLPPIIFESGYSMEKRSFFGNIFPIMTFALLGTLISSVVVGLVVYLFGLTYLMTHQVSFLDALSFGSIISATDPVTVLATFQALGVDPKLYALVFGESVLNDAVSIVLYHTLLSFQSAPVSAGSVFAGIGMFLVVFVGSLVVGVLVGILTALLFKHVPLHDRNTSLERIFVTLSPFLAYMLAEGLRLSGVVSILFSGITIRHYASRNLSAGSRRFSARLFHVFANIAEALVFLYIGVASPTLFTSFVGRHVGFLAVAISACLVGRYANIYGCQYLLNRSSRSQNIVEEPIPFIMWFSGLRGGVAYALASSARTSLQDEETGKMVEVATLFVVLVSMISIGATIGNLLEKFGLVVDSDSSETGPASPTTTAPTSPIRTPVRTQPAPIGRSLWNFFLASVGLQSYISLPNTEQDEQDHSIEMTARPFTFQDLDDRVLTPLFTSPTQLPPRRARTSISSSEDDQIDLDDDDDE